MGNFFRDDRSSGSSGGWRGNRKDFGGDRDKPEMHQTVCSECGNECEVPFKPNGKKPVFCRTCFKKDEFDEGGSDRRDFDRREYEKPRYEKPRFEKPAYKAQEQTAPRPADNNKAQFEMLNFKMDLILKTLHQMGESKAAPAAAAPKAKEAEAPVIAEVAIKVKKTKKSKKA